MDRSEIRAGLTAREMLAIGLIGVFVLLVSPQARADRIDILDTYPTIEYCKQVTGMFYSGAVSRVNGYARIIKPADGRIIELIEHRMPLPKEAIWATQWDTMNEREKEFMTQHVFMGYDSGAGSEDEAAVIAQKFFESCVRNRVAEKRL